MSEASALKPILVSELRPHAPVFAPMYAYLSKNEKFIGVKGPLDFFTPEELARLASFEKIYASTFLAKTDPHRETAALLRTLLRWTPEVQAKSTAFARDAERWPKVALPVNPYELSRSVLMAMSPLWSQGPVVEPFFAAAFASDFCRPLPAPLIVAAREQSVERYEKALLTAGLTVFLALHLGVTSVEFLEGLHQEVFEFENGFRSEISVGGEWRDLARFARDRIVGVNARQVSLDLVDAGKDLVAQRLAFRLKRLQSLVTTPEASTIYGPGGFLDV